MMLGQSNPSKGKPQPRSRTLADRFWDKVDKREDEHGVGCWSWHGAVHGHGYGRLYVGGDRVLFAHQVSLMLHGVEIPKGMYVDHQCQNKQCTNPVHLRLVTPEQNCLENNKGPLARNKAKKHCKKGHDIVSQGSYALMACKTMSGRPGVARYCLRCWPASWNNPNRIFITV